MGTSTTVRISEASHLLLRELAEQTQKTMQAVLEQALDEHRRRLFWEQAKKDFEELRNDPQAWQEEQDEMQLWDQTLADGLDDEDWR